jgi:hypothetical protein
MVNEAIFLDEQSEPHSRSELLQRRLDGFDVDLACPEAGVRVVGEVERAGGNRTGAERIRRRQCERRELTGTSTRLDVSDSGPSRGSPACSRSQFAVGVR